MLYSGEVSQIIERALQRLRHDPTVDEATWLALQQLARTGKLADKKRIADIIETAAGGENTRWTASE